MALTRLPVGTYHPIDCRLFHPLNRVNSLNRDEYPLTAIWAFGANQKTNNDAKCVLRYLN